MKKQGGTIANKNGSELENFIESILDRKGYLFMFTKINKKRKIKRKEKV
jgi:hypothetical protein